MENRTKIICTIGPASETPAVLSKMVGAGMDCVRLNFSHGSHEQFEKIIAAVRSISKKMGRHVALIQDLQGPKIRLGVLPEKGLPARRGDTVILATRNRPGTIPIQYRDLPNEVGKNDRILVNDGLIELTVISIDEEKTEIKCRVDVGGLFTSHKGINVPSASLSAPCLTPKDLKDLAFGMKHSVDFIALSFVKSAADIFKLREILARHKSQAKIIAKIERHEAIKKLEEIIKAADAVMVARGDLGIEVPAEEVPVLQKRIIRICNALSKPVIVATQMLASMIDNPRATRAEISDAATAIFDHADAFMLSNETAVGSYPVEATKTLAKVASAVERNLQKHAHLLSFAKFEDMPLTNATCLNATKLAGDINAKYIVAITRTGYTPREIAKYRPFISQIVFTPNETVARQMQLVWGVARVFVEWIEIHDPLPQIRAALKKYKLARDDDEIVVANAGFGKKEKLIMVSKV